MVILCVNSSEFSVRVCTYCIILCRSSHSLSYTMLQSLMNLIAQLAVTTSNMACSYVHYVVLYRLLYWTMSKNAVVSSFVSHCGLLYTLLSQISCSTQHGLLCETWITAVTIQYVCTIIIVCRIATLNVPSPTLNII